MADALSRLRTEGLDTSPLDEDIPVLAVETRASDALKEASPEEAPMEALTAQEIIMGQAEDDFCQARLKELDALPPPDPTWSRQAFFFRRRTGCYAAARYTGERPKWLFRRRCGSAS